MSEKLTPAIWDVDVSFRQDWKFADMHGKRVGPTSDLMWLFGNHHRFLTRLRDLNVDDFNAKVIERYRELRQFELTDEALCNRFVEVVEMLKKSGTAAREESRHCPDANLHVNINFDNELAYILDWIPKRMAYLDEYVFVEHRILRGDLNDDRIYDIVDVNAMINMILGLQPATPIGDVNYDSVVDVSDVNQVINIILGKIED